MSQQDIREAISRRFDVLEEIHTEGGAEFIVKARGDSKRAFIDVYKELSIKGYVPRLKGLGLEDRLILDVERAQAEARRALTAPLLLLAALATVLADAYYRIGPYVYQIIYFAIPAIVFIAVHEAVELLIRLREGATSMSYVVPGIPGIMPFMGFLNMGRVAVNRDSLFDMGFYPLAASFGALMAMLLYGSEVIRTTGSPIYFSIANYLFGPVLNYNNPVALGAAVSLATAFVNFMPLSPLDGGIVLEGMKKGSMALQLISVIVISLLGYFLLALVLIFMQGSYQGVEVLDEISELSASRKRLYWALLALAIASLLFMAVP